MMERELKRTFSQDDVRKILELDFNIISETFLKYVYDGYTYKGGFRAIRKPKLRKKIAREFHQEQLSKQHAQTVVNRLLDY